MKLKLKEVLEYNKLFAEENDQLKGQHSTLIGYVEDCKRMMEELKTRNRELETRSQELEAKIKQYEVPDRGVWDISFVSYFHLLYCIIHILKQF